MLKMDIQNRYNINMTYLKKHNASNIKIHVKNKNLPSSLSLRPNSVVRDISKTNIPDACRPVVTATYLKKA